MPGFGVRLERTYFRYFPTIGSSSRFVCSGTMSRCVMSAVASAVAHSQVRGPSMWPTASAIAFCAVAAFCSRLRDDQLDGHRIVIRMPAS